MAVRMMPEWVWLPVFAIAMYWGFVFRMRQRGYFKREKERPMPPGRFERIPRTRKRSRPRWKKK